MALSPTSTPSPRSLDLLTSLPAEIRHEIFLYAFIPPNLHLTPSLKTDSSPTAYRLNAGHLNTKQSFVRLWSLSTFPYPSANPFTLHTFNITRQFRSELLSLLFTHSSFTFTTINSARYLLRYLPRHILHHIIRITIPVTEEGYGRGWRSSLSSLSPSGLTNRNGINANDEAQHSLEELQRLIPRNCPSLRILTLELRLQIFESKQKSWDHWVVGKEKDRYRSHLAASYVSGFAFRDVETRIPCAERELDEDFLRDLRSLFGEANVRWGVTGWNKFAGVRGEVVVGGNGSKGLKAMSRHVMLGGG